MKIVFDLGGSVICPAYMPNITYIKKFSAFMRDLRRSGHKVAIVTGGGSFIKECIKSAREFVRDEEFLDRLGIEGTRINAMMIIASLWGDAYPEVMKSKADAKDILSKKKIPVFGGMKPGWTTASVAMEVAEAIEADMVIKITEVGGFYDRDPKKHANAEMLSEISVREIAEITGKDKHAAGKLYILDPVSVKLIEKTAIPVFVVGPDINNMKSLLGTGKFIGTSVIID
jgi:uridylate kinase